MIGPAGLFAPPEALPRAPLPPLYFSALVSPNRGVCYLAELACETVDSVDRPVLPFVAGLFAPAQWERATITTLTAAPQRYATRPFITSAQDLPASGPVEARLQPITIERGVSFDGEGRYDSMAQSPVALLELSNDDGGLDQLGADLIVEGRPVRISVALTAPDGYGGETVVAGTRDGAPSVLASFGGIFVGIMDAITWQPGSVRIAVRDPRVKLQRPVQTATYLGTGQGIDGSVGLEGVRRPRAFGRCRNITPVLVDPYLQIYQFNHGEARAVDAVRDMGVPLSLYRTVTTYDELAALVATDDDTGFSLGYFAACPAVGCFRLSGLPAGTVTADVRGSGGADLLSEPFSDGTRWTDGTGWKSTARQVYARTAAAIILRLLESDATLAETDFNRAQLRQIDAELPREAGLYLGPDGSATVEDCIRQLAISLGCAFIRTLDGRYQLRRLQAPNTVPVLTIGRHMIVQRSLERLDVPYRQPWSVHEIGYAQNWTVLSATDLAGAVGEGDRAFLTRDMQSERVQSAVLGAIYTDRPPSRLPTLLAWPQDAADLGQQLLALYGFGRSRFRLRAEGIRYQLEVLDTVRLEHDRYGLGQGRNLVVENVVENGRTGLTELVLAG